MAKIAIVFFSAEGHTRKQAEAVGDGAKKVDGADVEVFAISQAGDLPDGAWDDLEAAMEPIQRTRLFSGNQPQQQYRLE